MPFGFSSSLLWLLLQGIQRDWNSKWLPTWPPSPVPPQPSRTLYALPKLALRSRSTLKRHLPDACFLILHTVFLVCIVIFSIFMCSFILCVLFIFFFFNDMWILNHKEKPFPIPKFTHVAFWDLHDVIFYFYVTDSFELHCCVWGAGWVFNCLCIIY